MKWTVGAMPVLILCWAVEARAGPAPLRDPAFLNIGLSCRWEVRCMTAQRKAMGHALGYVRKSRPPAWRVHLCNRNATRGFERVDWVGFDHCIRNRGLGGAGARSIAHR